MPSPYGLLTPSETGDKITRHHPPLRCLPIDRFKSLLTRPRQGLSHRPTLMAVAALAVAIIFIFLLWKVPEWQTPTGITDLNQRALLQNELRRTIAQIALGLLVLGTLFVGWRRVRAADRTVEIASEQQITERFTRAIEQLGSDKMAIRLGGIYALERIAKDSPKDHWQVMEVLTAYVRENARWEGERDEKGVPVCDETDERCVPTDIQAILTVLGRRDSSVEQADQRLDLQNTNLRFADFRYANYQKAILSGANLQRADFDSADLKRTRLLQSNLQMAYLNFADLEEANLRDANLQRSELGANFQRAFLHSADFQGSNLSLAKLNRADLSNAIFVKATLYGTNLSEARGLTQEQIDSAIIDEHTILPDYLKRPQAES